MNMRELELARGNFELEHARKLAELQIEKERAEIQRCNSQEDREKASFDFESSRSRIEESRRNIELLVKLKASCDGDADKQFDVIKRINDNLRVMDKINN